MPNVAAFILFVQRNAPFLINTNMFLFDVVVEVHICHHLALAEGIRASPQEMLKIQLNRTPNHKHDNQSNE